jgi:thioredoxin 1
VSLHAVNGANNIPMAAAKFNDLVNAETPVLVDFSADWCGPCRMLAPVLKQVKSQMGDQIRIVKIDVDKNQGLAAQYRVQGVPTMILFQRGKVLWRQSGLMDVNSLRQALEQAMASAA